MSNPFEVFKEQMRQMAADKAAKKAYTDRLRRENEEAVWRAQKDLNEELNRILFGQRTYQSPFGRPPYNRPVPPRQPVVPAWCAVLGLPATASKQEIKSTYRKLAMKHHPDKGGNAATFQKITKAYEEATR